MCVLWNRWCKGFSPNITNPATKFYIEFINPHNKGGVVVDKWNVNCKYDSANDMKSDLQQKVEDLGYISSQDDFNLGFVIPGHSVKGKQQSIVLHEDMEEMYRQYRGRKEIVLGKNVYSTTKGAEVWDYVPETPLNVQ